MKKVKIRTEYVNPPIPLRSCDWQATENDYDPGCPIGYGATGSEALADLAAQLRERFDEPVELEVSHHQ